jgi:hypothetical protein
VRSFPADVELDIEDTETSPGVRRMQAMVGQGAPLDHGRQQMKLLAGLEATTKAVEHTAEAIGADMAAREQEEIHRAAQLDLPIVIGKPIPVLNIQLDGTGVLVVKKETAGRAGKTEGNCRRSGVDLEYCRSTLPRRDSDRRSLCRSSLWVTICSPAQVSSKPAARPS